MVRRPAVRDDHPRLFGPGTNWGHSHIDYAVPGKVLDDHAGNAVIVQIAATVSDVPIG